MGLNEGLTVWATILSTILAFKEIWLYFQNRSRISVSTEFAGDPIVGHGITIYNLGEKQVIVNYYTIFWGKRRWPYGPIAIMKDVYSPDELPNFVIQGNSPYKLQFSDEYYFRILEEKDQSLYIKLFIAGKKPQTILL